ncbi:MAG: hypothetical protein HQL33_00360 [Alphaproteobacteria bacterium]|nr:hypothetical protein [Alphaproteobacteria bacterium]MBF0128422.1 hypothetical protein [Alphaproteobacteria bacterium]
MAIPAMNVNPLLTMARMEMAVMEGWSKSMLTMFAPMARLCALPGLHGFCGEQRRRIDMPPQGVDLIGQYGHRAHDVDAERDI